MRISPADLEAGYPAFQKRERREAMYRTATRLVGLSWGNAPEVAEGLGVLLLVWNAAFYRHGPFDFDALEKCIARNQTLLDEFRHRDIMSYSPADDSRLKALFQEFIEALRICEGKCKGRGSPVSAAKALHLLAPAFFPLWDAKIAKGYGCYYKFDAPGQYVAFMRLAREIAEQVAPSIRVPGKTLLKLIDEYNYARFTKGWVE
jgi:hypothetical protein